MTTMTGAATKAQSIEHATEQRRAAFLLSDGEIFRLNPALTLTPGG